MWIQHEKVSHLCVIEKNEKTNLMRVKKMLPIESGSQEIKTLVKIQGITGVPLLLDYEINASMLVCYTAYFKGKQIRSFQLSFSDYMNVFIRGLRLLKQIHERSVFHRDLCPRHILMDEAYNVHIIDFGTATDLKKTESIMGTLAYAAPEALFDAKIYSTYSDLYAYAKVFYEIYKERFIKTHPHLMQIFKGALALDVKYRYQNCEEMLIEMHHHGFML